MKAAALGNNAGSGEGELVGHIIGYNDWREARMQQQSNCSVSIPLSLLSLFSYIV